MWKSYSVAQDKKKAKVVFYEKRVNFERNCGVASVEK